MHHWRTVALHAVSALLICGGLWGGDRIASAEAPAIRYQGQTPAHWQARLIEGDAREQRVAALALHRICPEDEAVEAWLAKTVMRHPDRTVRRRAAWALVPLRTAGREAALKALGDDDPEVQENMARSIGWVASEGAFAETALMQRVRDEGEHERVRNEALNAVASIGPLDKATLRTIVDLYALPGRSQLRRRAGWVLEKVGRPLAAFLVEKLETTEDAARRARLLDGLAQVLQRGVSPAQQSKTLAPLREADRESVFDALARIDPRADPERRIRVLLPLAVRPRNRIWGPEVDAQVALPIYRRLLAERGPKERAVLLRWIGNLEAEGQAARPALRARLADEDAEVRRQAGWAMSKVGGLDAEDEASLRAALLAHTKDAHVARAMLWALATREQALEAGTRVALRGLLEDKELGQGARYVLALSSSSFDEMEMVRAAIGPDRWARHLATTWLKTKGKMPQRALKWVGDWIMGSDAVRRDHAIDVAGAYGARAARLARFIAHVLPSLDRQMRRRALYVLAGMGPGARTALPVVQALRKEGGDTEQLLHCLGHMGDTSTETLAWMREQLFSRYQNYQRAAAKALAAVGPEGWRTLIEVMGTGRIGEETTDAAWAAVLGFRQAPVEALALLSAAREEAPPLRRGNLLRAMGMLAWQGADVLPALRVDLDHPHWFVRASVAEGLGSASGKQPAAAQAIAELLRDEDRFVREEACTALRNAPDSEPRVDVLGEALGDAQASVQSLGARAVHGARPQEAALRPALERLAASGRTADVRREAARALARLAHHRR